MKKKVLALRGVSNVGKSDTIYKVYDLLTSQYKNVTTRHEKYGVDIRAVLTINGEKIGIESQGDPNSRLRTSLELFVRMECKVIICATRTRGDTFNAVKELEGHGYEVIWFYQDVLKDAPATEQASSNLAMAKKLVGETAKIINAYPSRTPN